MFSKVIVLALALAAVSAAVAPDYARESTIDLRSFIQRCSYSKADINDCFVKNGNIAISELATGVEDLGIVSIQGFDIGDVFFSAEGDISFLLENVKSYPQGLKLENAELNFDEQGIFTNVRFTYSLTDYYWEGQYRGLGYFNQTKYNEKGNFRIDFGSFYGDYIADLKQIDIEGETFLKINYYEGTSNFEKFDFLPSNVTTKVANLAPEHFQQIQQQVFNKAIDTRLEYFTFVFNQILLEIPQSDLFLP